MKSRNFLSPPMGSTEIWGRGEEENSEMRSLIKTQFALRFQKKTPQIYFLPDKYFDKKSC